ncbi:MAG: TonB-dependent receptor [Muribaculaceae bacterium]|nr:TonB-dependent receptor [Muribaculaceae bacterium]
MRLIITYLLCFLCVAVVNGQVKVTGTVIDKEAAEPLAGASVMVKGSDGKIKKFATSQGDGSFSIDVVTTEGCRLEVTMMSFARQSIALDSVTLPVTIYMEPGSALLKEVTVKADRIREQGDTITYNVGSFAQKQDRSIGDVLNRMPGIDVSTSGQIKYQGEAINKFYIEGSDLLGGRYGLATNGINHEDVGAVEVMENHQPMQVLAGISFSDKAAINLKLKNKAKATWNVHGSAGGGYMWDPSRGLWTGDVFAMAVMPSFQNITTLMTNDIGKNISTNVNDFFSEGRKTGLSNYINVGLPSAPGLKSTRTLFNQSALVSSNSLWKVKGGEVKAQIDYTFNRVTADAQSSTTYFLDNGDRVITENRDGWSRTHSLGAKVIYELNQKTAFINNTLKTNIDWEDRYLTVDGSLPNNQSASFPDYYVSNNFKMIKRFNRAGGRSHLVTFESVNEWESLPQTLTVDMSGRNMTQHVGQHAFVTDESVEYAFAFKGIMISLNGGFKGYVRSMDSSLGGDLSGLPDDVATDDFVNVVNTNYFKAYVTPKFEYNLRRINFTLNVPLSYVAYTFDKALANRSEGYVSPSLSFSWRPNNMWAINGRGSVGRSPMSLELIQPGYVMTGYRSFRQGVDNFYNKSSQSVSATVRYKQTRRGWFGDAMVVKGWGKQPYTMSQQLFGDFVSYSYKDGSASSNNLMANGRIAKTLDFINGTVSVNGSYMRSQSCIYSENNPVDNVSNSWSIGGKLGFSPIGWLAVDYSISYSESQLALNKIKESWLGNMKNELLLNIMPATGWQWHISGEHYRNELTADSYKNMLMVDAKVIYKLTKRLELSASLTNILNRKSYNYITYSELSSYESQRRLRGRELMFTILLRK